VQAKS
jgi:hypothetical protein